MQVLNAYFKSLLRGNHKCTPGNP